MTKKPTVLILEDEVVHRQLLGDGLEDNYDYTVLRAKNVEEANGILDEVTPDILVLDIVMNEDRFLVSEWVKKLRAQTSYKNVPILFVTAHMDEMKRHVEDVPYSDVLEKPFTFEQVNHAMKALLSANMG